jgi:hypothetical protein
MEQSRSSEANICSSTQETPYIFTSTSQEPTIKPYLKINPVVDIRKDISMGS